MEKDVRQKRQLGVAELACYGIGNCIGSGIFVSMGVGIGYTGHSVALSLITACIVVFFAYIYRTLMAGMFVLPGGTYSQASLLQPPLLVGLSAITNVFSGVAFAMFGSAIVEYASVVFPGLKQYDQLIAVAIITLFFLTTILGGKFMAKLNVIMVAILLTSLLAYILFGLPKVDYTTVLPTSDGYFRGGIVGFVMAVASLSFACQGATLPVAMTADAKDPKRSLPKAILLASVVVMVVYCLIGIVSAGVLPVDQVANKNLGVVAEEIFPHGIFVIFILGGACFSIATSLFGAIASLQHPMLAIVEDGFLPAVLGKKTRNGYPWAIMLTLYLVGVAPIFVDMGLQEMISLMMIPGMLITTANNTLMIPLVRKYPQAWKKSFFGKMPMWTFYLSIVLSVFCSSLICVSLMTTLKKGEQYLMILLVAVLFAYSYYRLKSGKVDLQAIREAKEETEKIIEAEMKL